MTILGYIDFSLNFVIVSALYLAVLVLPIVAAVSWVRKRIRRNRAA